jgi:tyrosine-specific transport protein
MIGLPVVSALAGFIPSTLAMILVYFFATATGLLLVEAALWFEHRVHLVSLAKFALGNVGKSIVAHCFSSSRNSSEVLVIRSSDH